MSMMDALVRAYDRLAKRGEVPSFGYSSEKISFIISLKEDGTPASVIDWRDTSGKKPVLRPMMVPQAVKRTVGIAPNFLWDKTSYVLGVTAGEGKRLAEEHAAFIDRHLEALATTTDAGLLALRRFLETWKPENFEALGWPEDMKDQNVVFTLESERREGINIHDRAAAKASWARISAKGDKTGAICLVSGERAPIARLHPAIKGVWGAQSSGASLVSFNLDAFTSYGHKQGENAPVSEHAAFAYTTVLNKFLAKGSANRLQIGDASVVFWADGTQAETAEGIFAALFGDAAADMDGVDETSEARKVGAVLDAIRQGKRLADFDPGLAQGVRFYVLGLAPNAARLSVRFWLEDDFGVLVDRYQDFQRDMNVEPKSEREPNPPIWRYLCETAVLKKSENVPPNLAGDWLRSILAGTNYPLTLLSTTLMRLRADKEMNALRAAMLKAVLVRNFPEFKNPQPGKEAPVALDPDNRNKGYLLGRLFAVYEQVQSEALRRQINATIKDKYYGAASAQPRKVFALLDSGSANHLSKLGKQRPWRRDNLEKLIAAIMDAMAPGDDPFPAYLAADQQALFGLGYYHQRSEFFKSKSNEATDAEEAA